MTNESLNPVTADRSMCSILENLNISNKDRIPAEDRDLCQRHQRVLYQTLGQIKQWYDLLRVESDKYEGKYKLAYLPNGKVEAIKPYSPISRRMDYRDFEFKPFDLLNKLVDDYLSAIQAFANEIVGYFNNKYKLSVPFPEVDREKTPLGFQPEYLTFLDEVISYLGRMNFQEKAEEELIERFHKAAHRHHFQKPPILKNATIVFSDAFCFDDFYFTYNEYHVAYSYSGYIHGICEGIFFALDGVKGVGISTIRDFNDNNVDITKWYSFSTEKEAFIKFYRNGRMDIKFADKETALTCWNKLKMDEIGKG